MDSKRAELEAALERARSARDDTQGELNREVEAARREIEAAYSDRIVEHRKAVVAADKALRDHIDATAAHPWEGKRVSLTRPVRSFGQTTGTESLQGIVEVYRTGTVLPGNQFNTPRRGEPFVREIKKDGSPGKKIVSESWGRLKFPGEWRLVDGESDQ